jgi:hypothetical protein
MITLTPEVKQPESKFSTPSTAKPATVDQSALAERANKAEYGLGRLPDVPTDNLIQNFALGFEDRIRDQALVSNDIQERKKRLGMVQEIAQMAASEGRDISASEREFIMGLSSTELQNNQATILEQLYAQRFIDEAIEEGSVNRESAYGNAVDEDAEQAVITRDTAIDLAAKNEIAGRVLEEMQQRLSEASWLGTGIDFLKGVIPFYSWYQQRDRIKGTGSGNFFLGANIQEQMRGLYLQSPQDFELNLRTAVNALAQENLLEAVNFASAAVAYTMEDGAWDNVFTGLDAVDVATLGAAAVVKGALTSNTRLGVKVRTAVANQGKGGTPGRLVTQGNIEAASRETALQRLNGTLPTATGPISQAAARGSTQVQTQIDDLAKTVPSLLDTKSYMRDASGLSTEGANRILDNLTHNAQLMASTLTDVSHVTRVLDDAAEVGFAKTRRDFQRQYTKLEDHIVDIRNVRESDEIAFGVDRVEFLLGKKDATGFARETEAFFYANKMMRLPEGSYEVVAENGNFFIKMHKNVREDSLEMLDARLSTENQHPVNLQNAFLGMLRGADHITAKGVQREAKVATYGANAVMSRMAEAAKSITTLGKNEMSRLRDILDHARFEWRTVQDTDGTTKRVQGVFYKTVGELETAYLKKFNTMPTEAETEAYFTFRQLMDWDYVQRNLSMLRDKARLGMEQISFGFSKDVEGKSRYGQSEFFEGRTLDALPDPSTGPYTVAYVDPKTGKPKVVNTTDPGYLQSQKTLKEILEGGKHKVIQPGDPRDDILSSAVGAKGREIHYVVVRDIKTKPLSSVQIPYSEGGHWNYPSTGTYLKQPQSHVAAGQRYYDGDKVAMYFPSTDQGRTFSEAFNTARRMLLDPNHSKIAVSEYLSRNLPYDYDSFTKLFRDFGEGNADAPFKLDTPFVLTESGQASTDVIKLQDIFPETIVDSRNSPHSLSSKVNAQYAQQRNERLLTIDNLGTEANPQFKIDHAPLIDPLESLARNASQMAKSRFFEDYKHKAVEEWAHQFADVLDVPLANLRADPMRYLREPVYRESGIMSPKLAAAKNTRRNILSLLNEDSVEIMAVRHAKQKVVDSIYKAHGKKGVQLLEPWLWDSRADATTVVRSAVLHAKLGLFAPVQFPLQALSAMATLAIDGNPVRAMQAPYAYWAMRIRGLSESNQRAQGMISKMVGKALGIDTKTMDEMFDTWRRSGMHIIEGEYARMDDFVNPRMFFGPENGVAKTFDYGLVPFKEGNNVHRGTAFATSFLKWKAENPGKTITNKDVGRIVERADLLYNGMTRASNTAWQGGGTLAQKIGSLPAQFFTYHQRMTEEIFGFRLTAGERLRLLTVYGAMWGVPVGVGGLTFGAVWPMGEQIRQYMIENNISGDENIITEIFSKGLISMAVDRIVGTEMNTAERLGPGGMSFFRDLVDAIRGNDAGGEVSDLFGAGPGFITDFLGSLSPIGRAVFTSLNPNSEAYQLTADDIIGVLRNVSSVNTSIRAYQIYNSGQWLTRTENATATFNKEDPAMAIAVALGLSPLEVSDAYLKLRSNKEFEQARLGVQKEALIEYRRALKAAADGDHEQAEVYFKRAFAIMATGDFSPNELRNVLKQAIRDNGDLIDRVDFDYMMRDPEARMDEYSERLNRRITTKADNAN